MPYFVGLQINNQGGSPLVINGGQTLFESRELAVKAGNELLKRFGDELPSPNPSIWRATEISTAILDLVLIAFDGTYSSWGAEDDRKFTMAAAGWYAYGQPTEVTGPFSTSEAAMTFADDNAHLGFTDISFTESYQHHCMYTRKSNQWVCIAEPSLRRVVDDTSLSFNQRCKLSPVHNVASPVDCLTKAAQRRDEGLSRVFN